MELFRYLQTLWIARRKVLESIQSWLVFVDWKKVENMKLILQPGQNIKYWNQNFEVKKLTEKSSSTILLFNKPKGYVVSKSDKFNKTIYELLPEKYKNFYYVWRLDSDSYGLLLLTDNPALVNDFENPKSNIGKIYEVAVDKKVDWADIRKTLAWIQMSDEQWDFLKFWKVELFWNDMKLKIFLTEGRNRHIRRLLKAVWYNVLDLKRIKFWKYALGTIKSWEFKIATI